MNPPRIPAPSREALLAALLVAICALHALQGALRGGRGAPRDSGRAAERREGGIAVNGEGATGWAGGQLREWSDAE